MIDRRFLVAQNCINRIDDYLEYSYASRTPDQIKERIMEYIDQYSKELIEGESYVVDNS